MKDKRVFIDNINDNLKKFTNQCLALAFVGFIVISINAFIFCFKKDSVINGEWNKLKNDCELSSILDNGNYQYVCQIESNPITVFYNKLDTQHWEKFKTKNNCQLIKIDLTKKNKKQWLCNNNVNFYYDDN